MVGVRRRNAEWQSADLHKTRRRHNCANILFATKLCKYIICHKTVQIYYLLENCANILFATKLCKYVICNTTAHIICATQHRMRHMLNHCHLLRTHLLFAIRFKSCNFICARHIVESTRIEPFSPRIM